MTGATPIRADPSASSRPGSAPDTVLDFCTYCDEDYLPRALALLESLERHTTRVRLWMLCLGDTCYELATRLQAPSLRPVALSRLEQWDPELAAVKASRSQTEYYFSLSPCWPRYLLAHHPDLELLTYLDSDLYFYASPTAVLDELPGKSVGIVEHRFAADSGRAERYGRFNVGWITFRNDHNGRACLEQWRADCLEWCYDRPEPGRFADQKYLDTWPSTVQGVHVIQHPGANLAPWNLGRHTVAVRAGRFLVDERPLTFFHFQSIRARDDGFVDTALAEYAVPIPIRRRVVRLLYKPYLRHVVSMDERLVAVGGSVRSFVSKRFPQNPVPAGRGWRRVWRQWLAWWRPRKAALGEASVIRLPRRGRPADRRSASVS